jgi:hypothetical protein
VVKLFKKGKHSTETFKWDGSLKLKSLPMEEYTHVAYAFQVAMLRFERMLKESLLEGYVTSSTLEKITREFKIGEIRNAEIPDVPSIMTLFGSQEQQMKTKEASPVTHAPTTQPTPLTKPISPQISTPSSTPTSIPTSTPSTAPAPTPTTTSTPTPTSIPTAVPVTPSAPSPKISFSFPETSTPTPSAEPTPTPTSPTPTEPAPTAPMIPKISFPSMSKTLSPPSDPLAQSRGGKEEDRATGIAILRKQMLTELKKIRSVVSEEQR